MQRLAVTAAGAIIAGFAATAAHASSPPDVPVFMAPDGSALVMLTTAQMSHMRGGLRIGGLDVDMAAQISTMINNQLALRTDVALTRMADAQDAMQQRMQAAQSALSARLDAATPAAGTGATSSPPTPAVSGEPASSTAGGTAGSPTGGVQPATRAATPSAGGAPATDNVTSTQTAQDTRHYDQQVVVNGPVADSVSVMSSGGGVTTVTHTVSPSQTLSTVTNTANGVDVQTSIAFTVNVTNYRGFSDLARTAMQGQRISRALNGGF
ncbi:MAG TPA: hypothetical protein VKA32_10390 [Gammaproteobacteria bacterium]|nr:hypothetical protein [Gammaproteobacteria bacterium]